MFFPKIKTLATTAALALALVGAAAGATGAAAAGPPDGLPQASCLGQINGYNAAVNGATPVDQAQAFGSDSVGAYERAMLACKTGLG